MVPAAVWSQQSHPSQVMLHSSPGDDKTCFNLETWSGLAEGALHWRTCTAAVWLRLFGDALEAGELVLSDLVPMFTQKAQVRLIVVIWTLHCSQLMKLANSVSTCSVSRYRHY